MDTTVEESCEILALTEKNCPKLRLSLSSPAPGLVTVIKFKSNEKDNGMQINTKFKVKQDNIPMNLKGLH